jgi:hypothetical protein
MQAEKSHANVDEMKCVINQHHSKPPKYKYQFAPEIQTIATNPMTA